MDCEGEGAPPAYITPTSTNTANTTGNMPSKTNVYSQADGVVACLGKLFKLLRSIGGLIIILLVYTFLGAWIMVKLESPKEDAQKMEVFNARETIAEQLKNNTLALGAGLINQTEWDVRTENALLHFESTVHSSGVTSTSKRKWTFFGAALFCVTTYTTIGYGNITPVTKEGRIATMLYAVVGIPLALIVLADLGRHLTVASKFLWGFIRRYYYTGYCRKVRSRVGKGSYDMAESQAGLDSGDGPDSQGDMRRAGSYRNIASRNASSSASAAAATAAETCYREETEGRGEAGGGGRGTGGDGDGGSRGGRGEDGGGARDSAGLNNCKGKLAGKDQAGGEGHRPRPTLPAKRHSNAVDGAGRSQTEGSTGAATTNASNNSNDVHAGNADGAKDFRVSVRSGDCLSRRGGSVGPGGDSDGPRIGSVFLNETELNEDFKLPVSVAVGFIFAYMFLGAGMYRLWEDWTYLESFYFVFITTSTIGFGDVLPEHPNFFLLSCVYTFLGLALVSMTVNVIVEFLAKTIDRAKEKVDLAGEKAVATAKAAKGKLTEVGRSAKNKVYKSVAKEGSSSPKSKGRESTKGSLKDIGEVAASEEAGREEGSPAAALSDDSAAGSGLEQRRSDRAQGQSLEELPTPSSEIDDTSSFRTADNLTVSMDSVHSTGDKQ